MSQGWRWTSILVLYLIPLSLHIPSPPIGRAILHLQPANSKDGAGRSGWKEFLSLLGCGSWKGIGVDGESWWRSHLLGGSDYPCGPVQGMRVSRRLSTPSSMPDVKHCRVLEPRGREEGQGGTVRQGVHGAIRLHPRGQLRTRHGKSELTVRTERRPLDLAPPPSRARSVWPSVNLETSWAPLVPATRTTATSSSPM